MTDTVAGTCRRGQVHPDPVVLCCAGGGSPVCRQVRREFQQIVDGAEQRPLASNARDAPRQEPAEASGLFDLAEHGFDDLLAQPLGAAEAAFPQARTHRLDLRSFALAAVGGSLAMLLPPSGDEAVDATRLHGRQVVLRTIATTG